MVVIDVNMENFITWLIGKYKTEYGEATKDEVVAWVITVHKNLLSEDHCAHQDTYMISEYKGWLDEYEKYCKKLR